MGSPFLGMDPYLEDPQLWQGFHSRFINACCELLLDRLPPEYDADIEERVQLVEIALDAADRYRPDVSVSRDAGTVERRAGATAAAVMAAQPVTIPALPVEEVIEPFVQIHRRDGRELVTAVELLSPANKSGRGRGAYRRKRDRLVRQGVHVVEIDLLTAGERTRLARPLPDGNYYVMVFRGDRAPDVDVYAWSLPDLLPTVPIPLRQPDPDVPLDLAAVLRIAYERGRYGRKLRYDRAPAGAFDGPTTDWITAVTRNAAR